MLDLAAHYVKSVDQYFRTISTPDFRVKELASPRASYDETLRAIASGCASLTPSTGSHTLLWTVLRDAVPPFAFPMQDHASDDLHRAVRAVRHARENAAPYFAGDPSIAPFRVIEPTGRAIRDYGLVHSLPGTVDRPIVVESRPTSPEYESRSPCYSPAFAKRPSTAMSVREDGSAVRELDLY